mmetsp:Transcript_23955/g.18281  ORF Transcript_23955/g.18281 Transcript_23955/m.18281 type:complete len:85 (+) Transcript_23955:511-765(+)
MLLITLVSMAQYWRFLPDEYTLTMVYLTEFGALAIIAISIYNSDKMTKKVKYLQRAIGRFERNNSNLFESINEEDKAQKILTET